MKTVLPFIIIILCIAAYFMYIAPQISVVNGLRAQLAHYNATLDQAKQLTAKRDALLESYKSISSEDTDKLEKIIPETFNSVIIASQINTMASQYGLVMKNFKTADVAPTVTGTLGEATEPTYKTVGLTFSITGSYDQFLKFLQDMELSLNLLDVKNITLRDGIKTGSSVSTYEYLLDVNTYFLK